MVAETADQTPGPLDLDKLVELFSLKRTKQVMKPAIEMSQKD